MTGTSKFEGFPDLEGRNDMHMVIVKQHYSVAGVH